MAVVFDDMEVPGTVDAAARRVVVYLVASLSDSAVGGDVIGEDITVLDKKTEYSDADGHAELDLRANSTITPANTYYAWDVHLDDGRVWRRLISVPDDVGPYNVNDILTSIPPSMPGRSPLNILDYGAWIDSDLDLGGGHDDRAALLLALADVSATGRALQIPYGVTGVMRVSSGVTITDGGHYVLRGDGGASGPFAFGGQTAIVFDTGGFEFGYGQSGSLKTHDLYIIGVDAPAVHMNFAALFSRHNTCLRGYGAGQPGLKSTNNFFDHDDPDCSYMSGDTSTPSALIEAKSSPGSSEGWNYTFSGSRFNIGSIKFDVDDDPGPGAHPFGQFTVENVLAENSALPMLDVVWEAGADVLMRDLRITQATFDDAVGVNDVLRLNNDSGGPQVCRGIHLANSSPAGGGKHVQFAGSSFVDTNYSVLFDIGATIGTSVGTPNPSFIRLGAEGWEFLSSAISAVLQDGRFSTDDFARLQEFIDGKRLYGGGASAADIRTRRTAANLFLMEFLDATTGGELRLISPAAKDVNLGLFVTGGGSAAVYVDHTTGELRLYKNANEIRIANGALGFFNTLPITQPTITGSRGGNVALASLLTQGASLGLWIDGTS